MNDAAVMDGLASLAAASASSSVPGRPMGTGGHESVPGAWPATCRYMARADIMPPSAATLSAPACASRASACATSVRVTSPTSSRSIAAWSWRRTTLSLLRLSSISDRKRSTSM